MIPGAFRIFTRETCVMQREPFLFFGKKISPSSAFFQRAGKRNEADHSPPTAFIRCQLRLPC
uniref:Uncharacterized protein n=1 Tax=Utricularia reniformis TaxID=192314 RepID=A0A1Y0B3F8_9LAMI|nr:hypothetical protein AEK19_MT1815 [Utricularia reniformis]ART31986.1 hypothetical protein AEK19_MT1815 [Utricularia reniformis]